MGSAFYSVDEACKRLGRSRRSVFGYIKKGLLKPQPSGRKTLLPRDEVEALAAELAADAPAITLKTWAHLVAQVQKLEYEVRTLKAALEIRSPEPLRPAPSQAPALLAAAAGYAQAIDQYAGPLPFNWDTWAGLLEGVDDKTLDVFLEQTKDESCWTPLYRLCSEMWEFALREDRKAPSLEWQARARQAELLRDRLRKTIILWLEAGHRTLPESAYTFFDSKQEAILRRVAKRRSPLG